MPHTLSVKISYCNDNEKHYLPSLIHSRAWMLVSKGWGWGGVGVGAPYSSVHNLS